MYVEYLQVHKYLATRKKKNSDKSGPHIRILSESLRMMLERKAMVEKPMDLQIPNLQPSKLEF